MNNQDINLAREWAKLASEWAKLATLLSSLQSRTLEWPGQESRNSEEIVKAIRHEKELCLDSQDFSRAGLWRDMERAAGQGEWKDLLNSIRELKIPKPEWPVPEPQPEYRPEDVPPGEPWSVRYYGKEWAGVRADDDRAPWSIISMDGLDYRDVDDSEVTLMFRLVPEIP